MNAAQLNTIAAALICGMQANFGAEAELKLRELSTLLRDCAESIDANNGGDPVDADYADVLATLAEKVDA